jgi:uncharacterized membrane protein
MNHPMNDFFKFLITFGVGAALILFGSTITPWLGWMFYLAGILVVVVALAQLND